VDGWGLKVSGLIPCQKSRRGEIAYPSWENNGRSLLCALGGSFFITGLQVVLKECVFHAKECVDRVWASFVYF